MTGRTTTHRRLLCVAVLCLAAALSGCTATRQVELPPYYGLPPGAGPVTAAAAPAARLQLDAVLQAADRQPHDATLRQLGPVEAALTQALHANPHDRAAAETLGRLYYYQGFYGDRTGFRRCADFLTHVLEVDPDAADAARYLAHAYSRLGDAPKVVAFANQAASLAADPAVVQEMDALRRPFQERFLSDWYGYANYYESDGAKIRRLNLETYRLDVVLQVTPQFEQELAAKGLQQITSAVTLSQDVGLQQYLQGLVDRLVARSPGGPPFTYRVDVVESPEVNAMALPGRILVNTGLVRFADTEAELVAVLAHELAHVYAHHSTRQLVANVQNQQLAATLLAAVKVKNDLYQQLLGLGVAAGLELIERGYSRAQEQEADRYGTHIAFNAGYNPTFMSSFFVRLYEANPKQPFRLLSTHPPTTDRIEYTTAYLEGFPLDTEMQIDSQDFQEIKRRLP